MMQSHEPIKSLIILALVLAPRSRRCAGYYAAVTAAVVAAAVISPAGFTTAPVV